jgi:hypothetical protein
MHFHGLEDFLTAKLTKQANNQGDYYTGNESFDKIGARWNAPGIKPNMLAFSKERNADGIYNKTEIINDINLVNKIRNKENYKKERNSPSVAFEYIAKEGIHDELWFGEDTSVYSTSEYDDIVNGIDFVVKFEDEQGEYYLGIDSTAGENADIIDKKLDRNVEQATNNELFKVKYFHNIDTNEKKSIELPRVVIGVHWQEVDNLMKGFTNNRKEMQNSKLQIDFLKQTINQLSATLEYLIHNNIDQSFDIDTNNLSEFLEENKDIIEYKDLNKIIETYLKPLNKLNSVFEQKKSQGITKGLNEGANHLRRLYGRHLKVA